MPQKPPNITHQTHTLSQSFILLYYSFLTSDTLKSSAHSINRLLGTRIRIEIGEGADDDTDTRKALSLSGNSVHHAVRARSHQGRIEDDELCSVTKLSQELLDSRVPNKSITCVVQYQMISARHLIGEKRWFSNPTYPALGRKAVKAIIGCLRTIVTPPALDSIIFGQMCRAYLRDYKNVIERKAACLAWHQIIKNGRYNLCATPELHPKRKAGRHLLLNLISYVWDTRPSFKEWKGRRVTEQALHIADQLSKYTSYALWIDAICIDQDNEPVKMVELAKMADIYRGATAVLCLIPEIDQMTSRVVEHGTGMIDLDGFRTLEHAGDTHPRLKQGAAQSIQQRVSTGSDTEEGQLTGAIIQLLKLGSFHVGCDEGIHAARDSYIERVEAPIYETIIPDYRLPVEKVFADLVDKASSKGDFLWLRWSHLMDRDATCEGMTMVPVPATVLATPASAITDWRSVEVPRVSVQSQVENIKGIINMLQKLSYGPEDIWNGIINMLQKLSYGPEDIWNVLFSLHVGLACDVDKAVGGSGPAQALLNLTTGYIDGTFKLEDSEDDLVGEKPYTRGYGFTAYASMAAKVWRNAQLVVMRSQGGTTVVPTHSGTGQARLHRLPVESRRGTCLCLVVHDSTKFELAQSESW
ncbi:hypothetical protein BDR03DRAFT_998369 [Suillus americanus]|nr:hypothetical protein BDR03DRAFT_998369 [Suillus americanus]